jgi:hypothetical protein
MGEEKPKTAKEKFEETMKKTSDIRGRIINKSIELESLLDGIIINYFVKEGKHSKFLTKVCSDEHFSFSLKLKAINRIAKDEKEMFQEYNKIKKELEKLNELRNIVAHCISMNPFGKQIKVYYVKEPDGKNLEDLEIDFLEKEKLVHPILVSTLMKTMEHNKNPGIPL